MKPRIFINIHYLEVGGAERALLGLLSEFDPALVDVDLFVNQHTGDFMPLVPSHVNLLPERQGYNAIERPMKVILKEGQLGVLCGRLMAKFQHGRYHSSLKEPARSFDSSGFQYVADSVDPFLTPLHDLGEYDMAISFLQPHNIVLHKVKAKKKIAWIHTDYSAVHFNAQKELPVWSGYDYIVSISRECTRAFLGMFPSLRSRIIEIENILSTTFVRQQSTMFDVSKEMPAGTINLLSVGRYCHAKNYDNVPDIARRIVNKGYNNLRWYIIGFGPDESLIRSRIEESGMEKHVVLLGKKENPYPYISACDIYLQPSRYEGKSVTVREAQILCKPVVITNYATAHSQVQNGVDGIIVPMDNEGCAQGIINAINNESLLHDIRTYLSSHDYGNEQEVQKVYDLL